LTNGLELRLTQLSLPYGLSLTDLSFGAGLQSIEAKPERARANFYAQCVSAVLTQALGGRAKTVLLRLGDGRARASENAVEHPHLAQDVEPNLICKLRLAQAAAAPAPEEVYIIWLDDPQAEDHPSLERRFMRWRFRHFPLYDDWRAQKKNDKKNRALLNRLPQTVIGADQRDAPLAPHAGAAQPSGVILFCIYWLDFGGAEAFAIRSMAAAREAGFKVVVVADQLGRNRLIDRLDGVADAVYQIGVFAGRQNPHELMTEVVRLHRPDMIHIQHSWTAYRLLPLWRILWPHLRILDTTHILEHRHGGFVAESLMYSKFIDRHHVISADLKTLYDRVGFGGAKQAVLGRLHDLARHFTPAPGKWAAPSPLKIVFVGRFAPQKRPFLFLEIVRRLAGAFPAERMTFAALGSGDLLPMTKEMAREQGLTDRLEFLPGDHPVADVLRDAHVLMICSENEGLTLISYEAISADCLVISADVGGQREITPAEMLLPGNPYAFVAGSVAIVKKIVAGKLDPAPLLARQRAMMEDIQRDKSGLDVCMEFYRGVSC